MPQSGTSYSNSDALEYTSEKFLSVVCRLHFTGRVDYPPIIAYGERRFFTCQNWQQHQLHGSIGFRLSLLYLIEKFPHSPEDTGRTGGNKSIAVVCLDYTTSFPNCQALFFRLSLLLSVLCPLRFAVAVRRSSSCGLSVCICFSLDSVDIMGICAICPLSTCFVRFAVAVRRSSGCRFRLSGLYHSFFHLSSTIFSLVAFVCA